MDMLTVYKTAAQAPTGFAAEQILFNRGFYEAGRRTDAAAWTKPEADQVVRISQDARGSFEFFALAQKMKGNPYMPVVSDHRILETGREHIACVERLIHGVHNGIYERYKEIEGRLTNQLGVSAEDAHWYEEIHQSAIMSKTISNIFMVKSYEYDMASLPEPAAFREASIAVLELCENMHKEYKGYVPGPDFNPTNILWRRTGAGLVPVLYDPVKRQDGNGVRERDHTNEVRAKFGMAPLPS